MLAAWTVFIHSGSRSAGRVRGKEKVLRLKDDGCLDLSPTVSFLDLSRISSHPGQQNAGTAASGQSGLHNWHWLSTNCVYTVKNIKIIRGIEQMGTMII